MEYLLQLAASPTAWVALATLIVMKSCWASTT